jgi:hypothetical protein
MAASFALFDSTTEALPLTTATFAVGIGLIALTCKVVQKRGNEYRVSTLFYNEVVTVDDVCMTVTKPGPFWTRLRIHLRRPARFGWMISFVSADEGLADTSNRRGRI